MNRCESCGRRIGRKGRICQHCADELFEANETRYVIRGAITYTEYLAENKRISALAGYRPGRRRNYG